MSRQQASERQESGQLALFPGGSPASHSVTPGSAEAQQMTAISGRKCIALSTKSGPLGCLEKTLLASSIWRSPLCLLTWKPAATRHGHLIFRLQASAHSTCAAGASSSLDELRLWPTPTARDWKDTGDLSNVPENSLLGRVYKNLTGHDLSPTVSEWLMGFPPGWTDLEHSETP